MDGDIIIEEELKVQERFSHLNSSPEHDRKISAINHLNKLKKKNLHDTNSNSDLSDNSGLHHQSDSNNEDIYFSDDMDIPSISGDMNSAEWDSNNSHDLGKSDNMHGNHEELKNSMDIA